MIIRTLCISLLICSHIYSVSFSTDIVAGLTGFRQTKTNADTFDGALNFTVLNPISKQVEIQSEVLAGLGQSNLGFSFATFDLALNYTNFENNFKSILGSYDINFSHYSSRLSNNANLSKTSLSINPLIFNFFSDSAVADIGAIGLKYIKTYSSFELTSGLFNNINSNLSASRSLGKFVNLSWKLQTDSYISLAALATNGFSISDQLSSDISSWILSYSKNMQKITLTTYLSGLNYKNQQGSTESVVSYLFEAATQYKQSTLFARFDTWIPESSNSNSISLSNPSILSNSMSIFGKISRFSIGVNHPLDKLLNLKTDLIYEKYHNIDSSIVGLISYAKVGF